MKTLIATLSLCAIILAVVLGLTAYSEAQGAQDAGMPALVDAGPSADVSTLPDPAAEPAESASLLYRMYKSGALVGLAIVGVFFGLTLASRYIKALQRGKVAIVVTAFLAGLGMLAESAATRGTTPNLGMFLAALSTMLALIAKPTPTPPAKNGGV